MDTVNAISWLTHVGSQFSHGSLVKIGFFFFFSWSLNSSIVTNIDKCDELGTYILITKVHKKNK